MNTILTKRSLCSYTIQVTRFKLKSNRGLANQTVFYLFRSWAEQHFYFSRRVEGSVYNRLFLSLIWGLIKLIFHFRVQRGVS